MKKIHILGILLSLALVLGLVPGMERRAYAANVPVYVGQEQLQEDTDSVSDGKGGTATLTHDENGNPVLTLTNYAYSGSGHNESAIYYGEPDPLTIVLVGDNSITHAATSEDTYSTGIHIASRVDLTIKGPGSLTVAGGSEVERSSGIRSVQGAITISGGEVKATSGSAQYSYAIWVEDKSVTISGGKVTATSGSAQFSVGISGEKGVVISNVSEVEATGGPGGPSDKEPGTSYGIVARDNGISISNSKVTATGSSVTSSYYYNSSCGIFSITGNVTIFDSEVITSGYTALNSYGMRCDGTTAGITISGASTVKTKGGDADKTSCGIHSEGSVGISGTSTVTASGGNVANGNSNGICSLQDSISISGGKVTVTGNSKACNGTVKNAIPGMGWTDVAGTEGKTFIPTSTSGQVLDYLKAQFPAKTADVTFKVVNGAWDKGEGKAAKANKTVTLSGLEGDTLKLTAEQIPAVGNKPDDTYKAGSWDVTPNTETAITEATTYTYTYVKKDAVVATKQQGSKQPENKQPENKQPKKNSPAKETEKKVSGRIQLNSRLRLYWKDYNVVFRWGKVPGADTYEIWMAYCGSKKLKKVATVSDMNKAVIKKLGGKKPDQKRKVKAHVTAYRNGTKIGCSLECHSAGPKNHHTNAKKIKTSKNTYKLKVGRATKLKAKTIKIKNGRPLLGKGHGAQFRYASSDNHIATVSKNGKIRAVGTGKCNVWVYALNGVSKKVTVIVQ